MSASDLKKELVSYIESIDDEELLSLIKEDVVFYGEVKNKDITEGLNDEQLKELKAISEEEDAKDTQTQDEFKNATQQWRTK